MASQRPSQTVSLANPGHLNRGAVSGPTQPTSPDPPPSHLQAPPRRSAKSLEQPPAGQERKAHSALRVLLVQQAWSSFLVICFLKYSEQDSDPTRWKEMKVTFIYISLGFRSAPPLLTTLAGYYRYPQEQSLSSEPCFAERVSSRKSRDSIRSPWFFLLKHKLCYSKRRTLLFYAPDRHPRQRLATSSPVHVRAEKRAKQSFLHQDKSESRVLMDQTLWTRLKRR